MLFFLFVFFLSPYMIKNCPPPSLSIVIVLLEHHFTKSPVHHSQANISGQESNHPSVDEGHCWRVENFTVVDDCHPCTGKIYLINKH